MEVHLPIDKMCGLSKKRTTDGYCLLFYRGVQLYNDMRLDGRYTDATERKMGHMSRRERAHEHYE